MKAPFATAVAIGVGLLVLIGYLVPVPVFAGLRMLLLQWAVILAGVALLVGVVNLGQYHWERFRRSRDIGSVLLLISLGLALMMTLYFSPQGEPVQWLFSAILIPGSVALMALLAFTLVFAAMRLLRRRLSFFSVLFSGTVVFILLGAVILPGIGSLPFISTFLRPWLTRVPAVAGARGILLGVGLGTVATGLRILLGSDRPYGE